MKRSSRAAVASARTAVVLLIVASASACRETVAPPNSARLVAGLRQSLDLTSLETFFGPERFLANDDGQGNHGQLITRTIATDAFEAPFVLHVRNGTEGTNLVKKATVEFDGVTLLDKHLIQNDGPAEWSFSVTPAAVATLNVSVDGNHGGFLEIWLEGKRSATLFCPDGRPGSVTDLRLAIAQTPAGGTVTICDGTHIVRGVVVAKPLTIEAAGPGIPVLDPGGPFTGFIIQDPAEGSVTLRELELLVKGGTGIFVGANNDRVIVERSIFRMIPSPTSPAGGSGIFAQSFATVPAVRTAILEVRGSEFHGGFRGVDVGNGIQRAELTGNYFEHAQAIGFAIGVGPGGRLVANQNVFAGCGEQCVGAGANGDVDFDDNQVTVDISAPSGTVVNAGNGGAQLRMNRNTITGIGRDLTNPDPSKRFPIREAISAANGATVLGSDNKISGVNTAFNAFGSVTMHRTDVADYGVAFNASASSDLRCNWWGSAFGPSAPPHIPPSVYVPWSSAPIAGTTLECDPSGGLPRVVRACPTSDGSPVMTVPTVERAVMFVATGGTVRVCDGTHSVQTVWLTRDVTIVAEHALQATIDASGIAGTFNTWPEAATDVTLRGLRFVNANGNLVNAQNFRGSLLVEDSEFHSTATHPYDPARETYQDAWHMGGIGVFNSSGQVTVRNSTFIGGDIGIHANNANVLVQGSRFRGQNNAGTFSGFEATVRVETSTYTDCGRMGCAKMFSATGGRAEFVGNTFTVNADHPVFTPINFGMNTGTALLEDNEITGVGGGGDRSQSSTYPIDGFAMQLSPGAGVVLNRNRITNAYHAFNFTPTSGGGSNNVVSHVFAFLTGGGAPNGASATFARNDITDYVVGVFNTGIFATLDLRCNWWGSVAGPTNVGGGVQPSSYMPWAVQPIAGQGGVICP